MMDFLSRDKKMKSKDCVMTVSHHRSSTIPEVSTPAFRGNIDTIILDHKNKNLAMIDARLQRYPRGWKQKGCHVDEKSRNEIVNARCRGHVIIERQREDAQDDEDHSDRCRLAQTTAQRGLSSTVSITRTLFIAAYSLSLSLVQFR